MLQSPVLARLPFSRKPLPRHVCRDTRYQRYEGFHVLRLSGSDYEMGYQHGTLLREAVARGPIPYFSKYIERLLVGSFGALGVPAARAVRLAAAETVGRIIAAQLPKWARDGMDGLADGAQIPRRALMQAATMPETVLWIVSRYMAAKRFLPAPRFLVPTVGCTSIVAWGDATKDGALLHGRNFDYQGVGTWDREPVIAFHAPDRAQRYVSVASAGVLFGGITAMNAAGLTMVVHQHFTTKDFDLGGAPVGIVGEAIMRHAKSIDDARRILDEHVPNGAWTYIVTSSREAKVLCYQVTSKRRAWFCPEGGTFSYANIYTTRALEGAELFAYPAQWRHNVGRYHRAKALLAEHRGQLDADRVASFLGDVGDPRCRFRDSISSLQTVASVVFDPSRGRLFVATGRAPVSNQRYFAFDLRREGPDPSVPPLDGGAAIDPDVRLAFESYRDAYEACFNEGDVSRARTLLEDARCAQPKQAVYAYIAGLLALGAGDAHAAGRAFDAALALGHPDPERTAAFHLWRARARDRAGDRDGALRDYREATTGDPAVRAAAEKGQRRPWKGGAVPVEWNFADVVEP